MTPDKSNKSSATTSESQPSSNAVGRRRMFRHIGPALVLATVVIGPGSLTLNTIAGSLYGYQLLWVPVIATAFMILYTWMSARIGLVTGQTLFQVTRTKYGSALAKVGGLSGFLAVAAFQAGNSAAVGFAAHALFGWNVRIWATVFFLAALALIWLPDLYRKLELLVKLFVGVMILAFLGTLVLVGIRADAALAGLAPSFPDQDSVFLTLGMTATTFSIAAAVYQGYLMKEKKWGPEHLGSEGLDTFVGIGILGGISIMILLTSAGAIYGVVEPVFSAQGMAAQLEPLAGPAASLLFTCGFFFASFSSLIVNPLIGAALLTDGIGQDASMEGRPVRMWSAVILTAGLVAVLIFNGSPIELLRIAQGLAVVAFPVLGVLVLSISRDRGIMGRYAHTTWMHVIGILGYLAILGIVLTYIGQITGFV